MIKICLSICSDPNGESYFCHSFIVKRLKFWFNMFSNLIMPLFKEKDGSICLLYNFRVGKNLTGYRI